MTKSSLNTVYNTCKTQRKVILDKGINKFLS